MAQQETAVQASPLLEAFRQRREAYEVANRKAAEAIAPIAKSFAAHLRTDDGRKIVQLFVVSDNVALELIERAMVQFLVKLAEDGNVCFEVPLDRILSFGFRTVPEFMMALKDLEYAWERQLFVGYSESAEDKSKFVVTFRVNKQGGTR